MNSKTRTYVRNTTASKSKSLSPLKSKSLTQSNSSNSIMETPVSDILTQFFSPKSESLTPSKSKSLTQKII